MYKSIYLYTKSLCKGILFVFILSFISVSISSLAFFKDLHISSLTLAIIIGMIYGNVFYHKTPSDWFLGITYAQKKLLRWGIILYGFRITFQQIFNVGLGALFFDIFIVIFISILGYFLGTRCLKLGSKISLLVSAGTSICGAAAVLSVESTIKPRAYETSIAIATVVLFGTIAMFFFPYIVQLIGLNHQQMGIALGGTVHEVAQVVAAGSMIHSNVESTAVIVKLTRVMLLVPFLIILGWILSSSKSFLKEEGEYIQEGKLEEKVSFLSIFPWFALGFIFMSGIHSLGYINKSIIAQIVSLDNFILTMAMAALGIESNFKKMKTVGFKPFILAGLLFFILIFSLYIPILIH